MGTPSQPAPRISVVLPVAGVEDYLPACLDSVLGQSFASLEVIAVDDASADGCGPILDARASQDPRLRVIHLATSGGPGPARNLGLAQARGDYIWFADPDDLLTEGSLRAVADAVNEADPDVLLIDYQLLYPSGRAAPSPGQDLLREPMPPGPLAVRPALINRTMTSWSKVFRLEFLRGLGVSFPPGIHEDVPVSSAALLTAGRIAVLNRVCYLYRQRRRSFLATPSMAHLSIFDSYGQVFGLLADNAAPAAVAQAVFGRAMEHYSTVLASGLVPRGARRAFFHRMAADYARYRPAGYRPPAGLRGQKIRLVARDAYVSYTVLRPLNAIRVAVQRTLHRGTAPAIAPAARVPGVPGGAGVPPG